MANSSIKTEIIVIKSYSLRESDQIVVLLTESQGRLSAVARSGKKSKKRFFGGVDLFDSGLAELSPPKKGSLYILEEFARVPRCQSVRTDLGKFLVASLLAEVIYYFAPEGDLTSNELFLPLIHSLEELESSNGSKAQLLEITTNMIFFILEHSGMNPHQKVAPHQLAESVNIIKVLNYVEKIISKPLASRESFREYFGAHTSGIS